MKELLLMSAASLLMSCAGAADSKDTAMPLAGSEWGTEIGGQYIQFMGGGESVGQWRLQSIWRTLHPRGRQPENWHPDGN